MQADGVFNGHNTEDERLDLVIIGGRETGAGCVRPSPCNRAVEKTTVTIALLTEEGVSSVACARSESAQDDNTGEVRSITEDASVPETQTY